MEIRLLQLFYDRFRHSFVGSYPCNDKVLLCSPVTEFQQQGGFPHSSLTQEQRAAVAGADRFTQTFHKLIDNPIPADIFVETVTECWLKVRLFIRIYTRLFFFTFFFSSLFFAKIKRKKVFCSIGSYTSRRDYFDVRKHCPIINSYICIPINTFVIHDRH